MAVDVGVDLSETDIAAGRHDAARGVDEFIERHRSSRRWGSFCKMTGRSCADIPIREVTPTPNTVAVS